jgi:hypothetical protein
MANVYAVKSGNWSDTTVWNTSALPTSADDVYANNFNITVNQNVQVLSLRTRPATGINNGGQFRPNNGVIIIGDVVTGSLTNAAAILFSLGSPNSFTLIGSITGGSGAAVPGVANNSTGTINITGNSTAGTFTNCHGIANNGSGVVNLFGDAYGGSSGNIGGVANTATAGICNIIGNVYSGTQGSGSSGILNTNQSTTGTINLTGNVYSTLTTAAVNGSNSASTINIYGSVFGGSVANVYGVVNNSATGSVLISGSAVGGTGSAAYGAVNASTGILRVKRAVGNDWGLGYTTALGASPGVFSSLSGSRTFVEELECGPRGQWPTGGVIFFTPNPKATALFKTDTFQNYTLIQSNSADNLLPPVSSVRQNEIYNLGMDTGTCVIPPASSVSFGASVDNTTGTATLISTNVWNISSQEITDSQSLGGRLKNTLTANAAEKLVNSFNLN